MAAKREWTKVSDLVGEIQFSLSGGKPGTNDFIPKTDDFIIRVTYANDTEKMKAALNSTRIAVQNVCRTFYRKNKRFPFAPGKVQAVNGEGEFVLPPEAAAVRALQVLQATVALTQEQRQAAETLMALLQAGPQATVTLLDVQREAAQALVPAESTTAEHQDEDDTEKEEEEEEYKYAEDWLKRQTAAKLKVLAQNEELEGYDEMTKDELVEELALIEK